MNLLFPNRGEISMINAFQKLAIATTCTVLSSVAMGVNSAADAALTTNNFNVTITQGNLTGNQFSGLFTYESTLLTNRGLESISADQGLKVSFNFLDQAFTEADDFFASPFPVAQFNDGDVIGLNYFAGNDNLDFRFGGANGGGGTVFAYSVGPVDRLTDSGSGTVTYSVPEPATLAGLGVLSLGLLLRKKKAIA
jgi:PEP-CTERM motif